jgi:retron-type reverse transcriptase
MTGLWERLLDQLDPRGPGIRELERRLDLPAGKIQRVECHYNEFVIRKKSGKQRRIAAPHPPLKQLQRRILRRLLAKLKAHPLATGFQPGVSFVDNARCHQSQAVIIRIDLVDFFPSTRQDQVFRYFRQIGWSRKAARRLTQLTTWQGGLPQGAPTSPRLSNLVHYRLDARISGFVGKLGGIYTRYADDITVSFSNDESVRIDEVISVVFRIIREMGHRPHVGRKFDVRRSHQRQVVTGLVVNDRANLARETRRWLRAVEHRHRQHQRGGSLSPPPTLSDEQLRGWRALRQMIEAGRQPDSGQNM